MTPANARAPGGLEPTCVGRRTVFARQRSGTSRRCRTGSRGETWRDLKFAPPRPAHGLGWVRAPGGATFHALSGDGSGAYWKSSNRGETWSRVVVAGH